MRKITEGKGIDVVLEGEIAKYQFRVGILQNKQHYAPTRGDTYLTKGLKQWRFDPSLGLNVLQQGRKVDGTLVGIARELDTKYHWLTRPWATQKNADVRNVINLIVRTMAGKDTMQRIVNSVQAVVRNPILRGDYGTNSARRAKQKGFNKLLIATGQFFKNIKAELTKDV